MNFDMEMEWLMSKQFESVTRLIPALEKDFYGYWNYSDEGDGSAERPFMMPHVSFSPTVYVLFSELNNVVKNHPEYTFKEYRDYLFMKGYISTKTCAFPVAELSNVSADELSIEDIFVMLFAIQRADRFCEGVLLHFFKDGTILKWLKTLEKMDV